MKKYSIELNEKQIHALIEASDFEARIMCGQVNEILLKGIPISKDVDRDKIRRLLSELKKEMFPELDYNESYGIFNPKVNEDAKILYDLHQAMRYTYSWSNKPEGDMGTWFDDPMRTSNEELPIVKEIK